MANERDTTPVTIDLDRKRPYRVNDSDRDAVWVGPGTVGVPRWVAQSWGVEPITQDEPEPPVVVETVTEKPLETVETIETVETEDAPVAKTTTKKRKGKVTPKPVNWNS